MADARLARSVRCILENEAWVATIDLDPSLASR